MYVGRTKVHKYVTQKYLFVGVPIYEEPQLPEPESTVPKTSPSTPPTKPKKPVRPKRTKKRTRRPKYPGSWWLDETWWRFCSTRWPRIRRSNYLLLYKWCRHLRSKGRGYLPKTTTTQDDDDDARRRRRKTTTTTMTTQDDDDQGRRRRVKTTTSSRRRRRKTTTTQEPACCVLPVSLTLSTSTVIPPPSFLRELIIKKTKLQNNCLNYRTTHLAAVTLVSSMNFSPCFVRIFWKFLEISISMPMPPAIAK